MMVESQRIRCILSLHSFSPRQSHSSANASTLVAEQSLSIRVLIHHHHDDDEDFLLRSSAPRRNGHGEFQILFPIEPLVCCQVCLSSPAGDGQFSATEAGEIESS